MESLKSTNKKSALIESRYGDLKIGLYLDLIKQEITEFLKLNEEILKIDLINKGIMTAETWEQIDRVVIKLQEATA